jgi:hypothetical protein
MTADSATGATPDARWADLPRLPVLTPEFQEDPHRLLHEAREHPVTAGWGAGR